MKLGISYPLFDGEELFGFLLNTIRPKIDFVSVFYQETSYFGNPANPEMIESVHQWQKEGLIDKLIKFTPDLTQKSKFNELNIRNQGITESANAGCTHHISSDCDEFPEMEKIDFVKKEMEGDYHSSVVHYINYYKNPCWQITPIQGHCSSFIQPVTTFYDGKLPYPHKMELTRRPNKNEKIRVFPLEEFAIHHMTYVRKDIRTKLRNSPTGKIYEIDKFATAFDKYQLGEKLCVAPDFNNRRTKLVPNLFGIKGESWEHHQ